MKSNQFIGFKRGHKANMTHKLKQRIIKHIINTMITKVKILIFKALYINSINTFKLISIKFHLVFNSKVICQVQLK